MRLKLQRMCVARCDAALIAILAITLFIRVWGISFGLPYEYHVDEDAHVRQAASMGAEGLSPHNFRDGPFYKYVLLAEYVGLFGVGKLLGWYASPADFGARHLVDPTPLYLLGRLTSAMAGAITVLLAYLAGKAAYNRQVGLLAAWFLAVAFLAVRQAHYAVNDTLAAMFVMLSVLASLWIVKHGSLKYYVLAGVALGLGFATKYTSAIAVAPFLIAHVCSPQVRFRSPRDLKFGRLLVGLFSAGLGAVMASPFFVLEAGRVLRDVQQIASASEVTLGGWQIDPAGGYLFYLKSLWWGLGMGLFCLCLAGVGAAIWRHRREDIVLLSLPLALYLYMGRYPQYFDRWILPTIPMLAVLGALALDQIANRLALRIGWQDRLVHVVVIGVALALTWQPLADSVRYDYLLTQTDTRTLAKQWIEANIPESSRIALDWRTHGPPLSTISRPVADSARTYDVLLVGGTGLADHPIEWYREQGFDYLIASSFIYNIPLVDEERDVQRRAFYVSLDRELELVREFRPCEGDSEPAFVFEEILGPAISLWQRERPGPTIKIYRVNR